MENINHILTDIEGTTTSISFVHDILFPLSYHRMEDFISKNFSTHSLKNEISNLTNFIQKENNITNINFLTISTLLKKWIKEDKKDTNLKSIQGKIWKEAFENGSVKGHLYEDIPNIFKLWHNNKKKISIFSSGSIEAQHLLFKYSIFGDMTHYIDQYFDTTIGMKKEEIAYINIANQLKTDPNTILFLSDIEEELDAAKKANFETILLIREDNKNKNENTKHKSIKTFYEI